MVAMLVCACGSTAGGGGGGGGGDGDAGGGGGGSLGARYLLYYEATGFTDPTTTPVCDTPSAFGSWTALLAPTPLDVRSDWPADLSPYRVVVFGFLGTGSGSTGLAPAQHDALVGWLHAGGTALFMTDIDFDDSLTHANSVLNALFVDLGVGVVIDGEDEDPSYYALPLDPTQPLGAGVQPLACGTVTYAAVTAPAVRVDATAPLPGKAVLATQAVGAGRVVVLTDATCLSDYDYATGSPPIYADCATASTAGASLGAFLHALGD
nr:hypothetical protein [Kofleriaceae bacterium]